LVKYKGGVSKNWKRRLFAFLFPKKAVQVFVAEGKFYYYPNVCSRYQETIA